MGWGSRQWLRVTPEVTFGTYNTPGTGAFWIRLSDDSAFTMEPTPKRWVVRSADGGNRPVLSGANRSSLEGDLKTLLYPVQAAQLLTMATTLTSFDLASYTLDHFDTVRTRRYLGIKAASLAIAAAAETQEGLATVALKLVGQKEDSADPTLAEPAITVFPAGNPYTLQELSGALTIGASARTAFKSMTWSLTNKLEASFESGRYVNNVTYCGRDVTLDADMQYASATDRTSWETQAAQAVTAVFTKASPAKVLTLNMYAANRINSLGRATPLGGVSRQTIQLMGQVDGTNGDFAFTEV
jgi:hypothetical protein